MSYIWDLYALYDKELSMAHYKTASQIKNREVRDCYRPVLLKTRRRKAKSIKPSGRVWLKIMRIENARN